jgi:hypothetical protein
MLQLGTEEKHLSLKRMMIIFVIFFTILVIILLILHFNKVKQATTLIINPQPEIKQNETAPKQLSESEVNQIKMDIVTGKREDVPPEIDEPKHIIVGEYLSGCDVISEVNERIICYELYYLNNNVSLKQQKMNCEKLSGNEQSGCLDEFYYSLANTQDSNFCAAIKGTALSKKCLAIG